MGRPLGLPQRAGPAALARPGPLSMRFWQEPHPGVPLPAGSPLQEPLEHQAQVAKEDEWGRQRRALMVLTMKVEALELPEGVRVACTTWNV